MSAVLYYVMKGKIYKAYVRFFLAFRKLLSQMIYRGIFGIILHVGVFSPVKQIISVAAEIFTFSHMIGTFFQPYVKCGIYRLYSLRHKLLQQPYPHTAAFQPAPSAAESAARFGCLRVFEQYDAPSVLLVDFDQVVITAGRRPAHRIRAYINAERIIFIFFSHKG